MSTRILQISMLIAAATCAAACTTTGTGVGNARAGDMHASFTWQSSDDRSGTLSAALSNGDSFTGKFFQVTRDTRVESLGPLWAGWGPGWRGWRYWGPEPDTAFVTH